MDIAKHIAGPGWPVTYNGDGLVTVHNSDFTSDPAFIAAYSRSLATPHPYGKDLDVKWRVHVCCWAALQAKHLKADYVECGVFTGLFSSAVMQYIAFGEMSDRRFFLLDTFDGIPLEQVSASEREHGIHLHNNFYFSCYDAALKTFAEYANAHIIRGKVPDTLPQITSDRIGYVSMDLNCVEPEMAAGNFLWPRMVPGALIVLDDYGWKPHIHQKHAWDRFAAERGIQVLSLPTGQGLLIKPK
jgi:O-methyltransferase